MDKKKLNPAICLTSRHLIYICLIFTAIITELVIFNFSAWKSLFYHDSVTFENIRLEGASETFPASGEYIVTEENPVLYIDDFNIGYDFDADTDLNDDLSADANSSLHNIALHNLFIDISCTDGKPLPCTIMLTDEGNYYPYSLPEKMILPEINKSHYTNVYPAGKVNGINIQLSLPAESHFTLNEVCANVHIPFMFSILRFLLILGILLLFYKAAKIEDWKDTICNGTRRQFFITAAVIVLLIVMAWGLVHVNPICITSPWPHHKQYQELVEVMAKGQVYLDTEPSEALLNAANPYDTIYLQANGIDYLADYAYHDGKYYVYFGIVPELLLYFPFYMLTGHHLPNYVAVFIFYCGFIIAVFSLIREIIRRWFVHTPFFIYLMTSVLTVCCGNYLFVIARPDLYDTPIMAANMFTAAGLFFWLRGKYTPMPKLKRLLYALGSLSMALVAGCRPQMLLFSLLALPIFWSEFVNVFKLKNVRKAVILDAIVLAMPYIFIAAGIMYYNAVRFGSVFDFGASYSLTSNDMTKRSFNLHQTLLGLWHYFMRPPVIESDFPFLQGIQITSDSYMGKLNAEYTYGGLLTCNAFLWILLYIGRGKELLKKRGAHAFTLLNICISAILCIVDVTGAGILQRYMVDMILGLWLGAILLLFSCVENAKERGTLKSLMLMLSVVCILQAFYGFGVIFGNGDLSVNVRTSNPGLYYYLYGLFDF